MALPLIGEIGTKARNMNIFQVKKRNPRRFVNTLTGELQEEPSREATLQLILSVPGLEFRAFCALMYLTGARLNEVVKQFSWRQITEHKREKGLYWFLNEVVTLKRGKKYRNDLTLTTRTLPILYKADETHRAHAYEPFFTPMVDYIKEYNISPNTALFSKSDRHYRRQTDKELGFFPHYFRHLRASHLVRYHKYNVHQLQRWFGWTNLETPKHYVNVVVDDLL